MRPWLLAAALLLAACAPRPEAIPAGYGARCPWTTYEAEDGRTNGTICGPSRIYRTPEAESSGRRHVRLPADGSFVEITAAKPANAMVVRFSIPDHPAGGGTLAALALSINGRSAGRLELSSRHAWVYGNFPWSDDPADGRPHRFFDECRALIPQVAPGDVLRLQQDTPAADPCLIDLIELEQAAPPLPRPAGSLSIADFGAVPDDGGDDTGALEACLAAARAQGRAVWIPAGTFTLGRCLPAGGVAVHGAGMWHTTLAGPAPGFIGTGEPLEVADLALSGAITRRHDQRPDNAFTGNFGQGSAITRVWIEHVKCGIWSKHGTLGLRVTGCRIRNTMADGINFCDGTSQSLVADCHLRNTGDDALATWSPTAAWSSRQPCVGNRFVGNTIQLPWLANGIGVYGGSDHQVEDNLVLDTVFAGGGIDLSSAHGAAPFAGTTIIRHNALVRTGGESHLGGVVGSLWFHAAGSDIAGVQIEDLLIREPGGPAITVRGPHQVLRTTLRRLDLGKDGGDLPPELAGTGER